MIAVDTNILIYAHCENSPFHQKAHSRLKKIAESAELWAIPIFCIAEFVRVVTHPKLLNPPTLLEEAFSSLKILLASPSVRVLSPQARFFDLFETACSEGKMRGNLVFDAQIVAVMLENGVNSLLSEDRDFRRFSSIRVVTLDDQN